MNQSARARSLALLQKKIIACSECPRLVGWREKVVAEKTARFRDWHYWGKPIPSFGDPAARLLLVGLAPAAHGGNRTGRMFTGDRSGDWLFRALHKSGYANQPESMAQDDGLKLNDCYIVASVRCAPPGNKPLPVEFDACRKFLLEELPLLPNIRVVVGLGKIGCEATVKVWKELGWTSLTRLPAFKHGAEVPLNDHHMLICSFHPSQQNTFTGKLTEPMFDAVFSRAKFMIAALSNNPR